MTLPFRTEQFFAVLGGYNQAVWPAPVLLVGLALLAVAAVFRPGRRADMVVSAILAVLWAWLGIAYHLLFFTRINPAAWGFGAISLVGAAVFLWQGVVRHRLRFAWPGDGRGLAAVGLVLFALVLYPLWVRWDGHMYPATPTFGLPCPTTIFTLGVLACLVRPYPRSPFVVPLLWCAVGAQAAFLLDMWPDVSLVGAGVIGLWLVWRQRPPRTPRQGDAPSR